MKAKFNHFVGIDPSKLKVDVCAFFDANRAVINNGVFDQTRSGFKDLDRSIQKHIGNSALSEVLIVIENTGLYDDALAEFLYDKGYSVCLENAALIKKSIRDRRAKNDKLDARNIALYGIEHAHELELWEKPRKVIQDLKYLLAERAARIEYLKGLKVRKNERAGFNWALKNPKIYSGGIKGLEKDIEQIDKDIWVLIKSDASLYQMVTLLMSIPAIGKITATHFICYTNEFKRVKSGKNLASYCGVVPFEQSSGSSIRKKPRVSHQANKTLKRLLHLCALTAVRMKGEMALYYQRKCAEGKNLMMVLNAVRNKLVLRMAAVIKTSIPFDPNYIYSKNN